MKLRNIFLAGLAVCTMASCSKDDDINKGPAQPVDAQVSFGITTDAMTKATDAGTENERFVETLTALIFDTNGKLVGRKDTVQPAGKEKESIDKIEHVTIKVTPDDGNEGVSTETFKAVLIANAKDKVANVTQLSDLEAEAFGLDLDDYYDKNNAPLHLPMASEMLEFSDVKPLGVNHTENWIYKNGNSIETTDNLSKPETMVITLYRLVARIDLEKVTLETESGINFVLTRVFLANVAAKSPVKYLTSGKNELVETGEEHVGNLWKGFQSDSFKIKDPKNLIIPAKKDGSNIKDFLQKDWEYEYFKDKMNQSIQFNDDTEHGFEKRLQFYIFAKPYAADNHYDTRLVLEGLFKRTENSPAELRHYHVVLNKDGYNGVMANYIYKLSVRITGEGSPNENEILLNAHVAATIDVAPWNVIIQEENDTN